MKYAIKLVSTSTKIGMQNDYGYYTGKDYIFQGALFPVCVDSLSDDKVKLYSTKSRADNALNKIMARPYEYVWYGEVEGKELI